MPIYEYRCDKCGKEFEVFQGITEAPVKTCRFCQGPVKRLISVTTFHLKGTGWYVTDYGGKKAPAAESAREEKASPEGTVTDKGESSPAAGEPE